MLIIPAIDIKDSKVVRLERGKFNKSTIYFEDPLEVARYWEKESAELLHIVDLDGALEGFPKNLNLVKKIAKEVKVPIQVGGGIRNGETVNELLCSGVFRVVLGTKACEDIKWLKNIIKDFSGKIIVSLDVREGFLATNGWTKKTKIKAVDFAKELNKLGLNTFILTDIGRDGTLKGLRIEYIWDFLSQTKAEVIVAGGVGSLEDIKFLKSLSDKGVIGVIVGKALYEKKFTLKEAMKIAR